DHGAMAPLRSVAFLSGIMRSASMCCSTPRPPQAGQAPDGLLNENSRGSISEIVKPETGQANFSANVMRPASAAAALGALGLLGPPFLPPPPDRSRLLPTSVTLLSSRTLAIARFGWGGGRAKWHACANLARPPTPTLPHKGGGRRVRELHDRDAVGKLERLL